MEIRFDGKTAVITGGARGLGKAAALEFAAGGADIVIGDLLDDVCEQTCEEIRKMGRKATWVHCDVTNVEQCEALVNAAESCDIMVNAAGIGSTSGLMEATQEEIQRIMNINAVGSSNMVRAAFKRMIPAKAGRVVLIASIAAHFNSGRNPAYAMSKAAVTSLVISAARTGAPYGITVNGVLPGNIRTPMWEKGLAEYFEKTGADPDDYWNEMNERVVAMKRAQSPGDIANAIVFLCSEEGKNITAQNLTVDGAMYPTL